ncbi:hypothetical protein C4552_01300 [Candidatus Parcubacteria bacterium]|nr:MAG: hypothetical protein C4552_01300 [Candidatus Parcubacteria bacterium]
MIANVRRYCDSNQLVIVLALVLVLAGTLVYGYQAWHSPTAPLITILEEKISENESLIATAAAYCNTAEEVEAAYERQHPDRDIVRLQFQKCTPDGQGSWAITTKKRS